MPQDRFDGLEQRPGVSPDVIALERRLYGWRRETADRIGATYPDPLPAPAQVDGARRGSEPLASLINPAPDGALLRDAADSFLDALDGLPVAQVLAEGLGDPPDAERLSRWFTLAWTPDGAELKRLAEECSLEADVLRWSARQLARPFFHRLGELLVGGEGMASRPPDAAGCPSCGGAPRMARYERDEGRRHLWCDLCNLQWTFPRVTCPFCLNRNQERLGYLVIEGSEQYRIDVCEECHGYLRAIDERGRPEGSQVDFPIEDVGTLHLGLFAEQQGYQPGENHRLDG